MFVCFADVDSTPVFTEPFPCIEYSSHIELVQKLQKQGHSVCIIPLYSFIIVPMVNMETNTKSIKGEKQKHMATHLPYNP